MINIINKNREAIIEAVKRAVAHDTTPDEPVEGHPFGVRLSAALDDFLEMASVMGFYTKNVDNYVGYVEMGEGEKLYGILCHLDVVPVGDSADWITPPFNADVRDGKLYGRGAIDDKGPAVAALFAMKAVKESGTKLNCRIRLILGLDEESGLSRCMEHYLEKEETPVFSFSPDADFPLINAEKGILRAAFKKSFSEKGGLKSIQGGTRINVVPALATAVFENDIKITASGKAAHAMQPSKGENAIQKLLAFMTNLNFAPPEQKNYFTALHNLLLMETDGTALGIACTDDVSGELTINLGLIDCDGTECTATVDIRYPVTADSKTIIKTLEEKAAVAGAEFTVIQHNPPLYIPEENEYIQVLLRAYEKMTGEKGRPKSTGGGTYCRNVPNSVSFGLLFEGEEETAHTANEYVSVESLLNAVNIYAETILQLNNH